MKDYSLIFKKYMIKMNCKIFLHKWEYYKEDVPHILSSSHTFMVSTEFRFCNKCFTNQIRVAHSSSDKIDWRIVELSKEQLREKKLKDLGI
jgi:hypothetical protein